MGGRGDVGQGSKRWSPGGREKCLAGPHCPTELFGDRRGVHWVHDSSNLPCHLEASFSLSTPWSPAASCVDPAVCDPPSSPVVYKNPLALKNKQNLTQLVVLVMLSLALFMACRNSSPVSAGTHHEARKNNSSEASPASGVSQDSSRRLLSLLKAASMRRCFRVPTQAWLIA